ncbi:sigma-70 family RNA polymerase sigma factor [Flavobacterium sp. SM15]|uniref:sigma-70 family RNA polymerase sigma factor n=1 Tax=Flavobacterium sp. SM15 TaxID=2908005 RepID=UPI001EDBAAB3|nr:sigma-70 family RNA polymerase sigma factor [Flavobacterium sp. SM15]MCG2611519.1 sigma-70 family RNA polymerase sigma factor [Flavobacterium sp. SM15]
MNNTYYNELRKLKTLDNEKVKDIYTRYQNGDANAINEIITGNLRFVVTIAKSYHKSITNKSIIELDDLISEGNIGLIQAATKFNLDFGVRFSTYAVFWIRKQIQYTINQHEDLIRLPANKLQANRKIKRMINQLYQDNQYQPTRTELEDLELFNTSEIDTYFQQQQKLISIDDQYNVEDVVENTDEFDYQFELKRKIKFALKYLTPKERLAIRMKFGIDQQPSTPTEIYEALQVSKQRVGQINQSALLKLRAILGTPVI